jgi:hypothetical protein
MFIVGMPFEDVRISMTPKEGGGWNMPQFTEMKGTGQLDSNMDRLPIFIVDGVTIGQSKR